MRLGNCDTEGLDLRLRCPIIPSEIVWVILLEAASCEDPQRGRRQRPQARGDGIVGIAVLTHI